MTELELAYQQMRAARGLIENFCFIDPTLWPILSEIDAALIAGLPKEHRARRLGGTRSPLSQDVRPAGGTDD